MLTNDLKEFEREFQNHNVFIIGGIEKDFIKNSIRKIYTLVDSKETDIRILDAETADFEEIKNACFTTTFFQSRKIVHIKKLNVIGISDNEKNAVDKNLVKNIIEIVKSLPDDTVLLITVELPLDLNNQLCKVVQEIGVVADYTWSKQDLPNYVDKMLNKNGKKIGKAEINYFLDAINYSQDYVKSEVDKLIDVSINEEKITNEMIDSIVTRTVESNVFKMVDSIGRKDAQSAISILTNLINQNEPILKILTMITRQFRLLYLLKSIEERNRNISEEEALKKLGLDLKRRFILRNLRTQNQKFSKNELVKCLNLCLETDFNIKSGKNSDGNLAMELLILNICK
ncbi:DNA polymerase III subunit delta [Caloramator mitchellensis]|nr:DNA polymerase III subunit delta [Caloramator mitchellensis]